MFNPHTKFKDATITCYEDMKGSVKCRNCGVWGAYESLKVTGNVTIQLSTYDFLIDFNTNYASIF